MILTPTGKKSRAALSSDVLEMLVDLKGGEEAEVAAADAFIDAWHKRTAAKTASEADRKKLTAALAGAFDEVIAQKSAKELRTVKDDYQKPTGFTTEEINDLVVDDLVAKVRKLRVDSGIDEMKLPDLRQKVIKAYTDGVKDDSDGAKKRLKALKTMMAIDYAAKTLEDLTAYKNEADKETAIGHLGSNLDEIVDTDQKIYVNPMIDGELVESDGKLQLRLVVKKGFESAVTAAGLYAAYTETTKELTALDLPVSGSFKVDDVTFDDGDEKKKWRSKMHNKKAENDAIQKLTDIRFPASAKTNRKLRFSKGKKSIAQKHKASLLSALAVVLEQQEKAKARNRQQGRVGAAR